MQNRLWLLLVTGMAALALALGACAPAEPTESLSPLSPPPTESPSPISTAPTGSGDLSPQVQSLVDQARDDLSERLDIPADEIGLQSVEQVQWRDSSLGCPKPGLNYLQVITPGYRIILEASGENYEYHTSLRSTTFCEG